MIEDLEDDSFDLDKFRVAPEDLAPPSATEARRKTKAASSKKATPRGYIRLPLMWDRLLWESQCRATPRVLNYLLEQEFRQWVKGQSIPVPTVALKERGVCRSHKEKALRELEAFGICTVERLPGKCPRVTLSKARG